MSKLTVLFLIVCFLISCTPSGGAFAKKEGRQQAAEESIPVEIARPKIADISSFLIFSSNIDSEGVVEIYPQSSGVIVEIFFDEGDKVQKGAVLAKIDDREAFLTEAKSRLNYEQLRQEFSRQKELFAQNLISTDTFERLQFNLEKARLDWETARLNLSFTRIVAPISGLVSKRYIKTGAKVSPAQPAFKIIQNLEKIAVVNIPESERSSIYLKQPALIISGELEIPAEVSRISPAIDSESGTFKTTLAVKDEQNRLAIGQFVNVRIIKKVHRNVLAVPKEALLFDEGNVFLFVVDNQLIAHKVKVKTGFEEGNLVEVESGLKSDAQVVVAGKNSLKEGSKVKIIAQ